MTRPTINSSCTQKSTIVRVKNWLRTGVKPIVQLTTRLAPGLAADLSETLLTKPRRYQTSVKESGLLELAERHDIKVRGNKLFIWSWGPATGPSVLLLHGWEGRGIQMSSFIPSLLARGYRVVTMDNTAHGESEGETTNVPLYAEAILELVRVFGPFQSIISHSMGAAASAFANKSRPITSSFVFVGAAVEPLENFYQFARAAGVSTYAVDVLVDRLEKRYGIPVSELSMLESMKSCTLPTLIIHDRDDRSAPWTHAAALNGVVISSSLILTEGKGHVRILNDTATVQHSLDFISSV